MSKPASHGAARQQGVPFAGRIVVLTRPRESAGDFAACVRALGGQPVIAPAIALAPPDSWDDIDSKLRMVTEYQVIALTSATAVRALVERAEAIGVAPRALAGRRLAAVGEATAAALAAAVRAPDLVAHGSAASLAEALGEVAGTRVLFPRGDLARETLPAALRARGARVDDPVVYRTVPGEGIPMLVHRLGEGSIDALLFASASAVRFTREALDRAGGAATAFTDPSRPAVFCIGPDTAEAARAAGLLPAAVAEGVTLEALIEIAARWFTNRTEPA